jgi:hypothetical protein
MAARESAVRIVARTPFDLGDQPLARKAKWDLKFNFAKTHQFDGLSKWPSGTSSYRRMHSDSHPQ